VKWAQWDKTQSRELLVCSYVCASHCAQLLHTILHRTDLMFSPLPSRQSPHLRWCLFEGRGVNAHHWKSQIQHQYQHDHRWGVNSTTDQHREPRALLPEESRDRRSSSSDCSSWPPVHSSWRKSVHWCRESEQCHPDAWTSVKTGRRSDWAPGNVWCQY